MEEYGRTALMELTIGQVRDTVKFWNAQEGGLCALLYRHYSEDRHFQADARRAAKRAGELLAMGISLTQPDFAGKTPQDHLREAGLTALQP